MPKYNHIILATDMGAECKAVAHKAVAFAELFDAKLSIVHTIEPIPAYGYPEVTELRSPFINTVKNEMLTFAKDLKIKEEDLHIEFGSVKTTILNKAEEFKADLIIVGSHGRHGLSRLLGSSASGIVHGADCDVYVIRCEES